MLSRNKRLYLTLLLVATIGTTSATFFVLSYNSAHGTVIQLVSASRIISEGSASGPVETLTYVVDVHVWSWGGSIQTTVNKPTFTLIVDNYSMPIANYGNSTGFQAGSYAPYHLSFTTTDESAIQREKPATSSTLKVSMIASVISGLYTEQRMVSDSRTVTW